MITYNHERFIAEAIESVLMQKTDFDYELVIGEDCSTDHTRETCQDYQSRYPDRVRLLTYAVNQGMMSNFMQVYASCKGEYIAMLEGDDVWSSSDKLQRQVAFMDSHPSYSMCFTRAACFDDTTGETVYFLPPTNKRELTLDNLLSYNQVATCTVLYRRQLIETLPDWFLSLRMGDWPMHILFAQYGPAAYLPEEMARYRLHAGGVYSVLNVADRLKHDLPMYDVLEANLEPGLVPRIREARIKRYLSAAFTFFGQRDFRRSSHYLSMGLQSLPMQAWFSSLPFNLIKSAGRFLWKQVRRPHNASIE